MNNRKPVVVSTTRETMEGCMSAVRLSDQISIDQDGREWKSLMLAVIIAVECLTLAWLSYYAGVQIGEMLR